MSTSKTIEGFISYNRADSAYASRVRDAAVGLGWRFFLDEESLYAGAAWDDEIVNALRSTDIFIVVLTSKWAKGHWTRSELDEYRQICNERSVRPRVVPLQFEGGARHLALEREQLVPNAAELTPAALAWVLHCAAERRSPGPRVSWDAKGRRFGLSGRDEDRGNKDAQPLTTIERVKLEDRLAYIDSAKSIAEIFEEVFGYTPTDLANEPRIAWYQIIRLAEKTGRVGKLRRASSLY